MVKWILYSLFFILHSSFFILFVVFPLAIEGEMGVGVERV